MKRARRCRGVLLIAVTAFFIADVKSEPKRTVAQASVPVRLLDITGPVALPQSELSALEWCGDSLMLVPQYPDFYQANESYFYSLNKNQILAYLDAPTPKPLAPEAVAIKGMQQLEKIPGYEGIEAMVCDGDDAVVAIELNHFGRQEATAYARLKRINDYWQVTHSGPTLPSFSKIPNKGNEALIQTAIGLVGIHEVNTSRHQRQAPLAYWLSDDLSQSKTLPMVEIPYRITDATGLDQNNRFWVINYLWEGEKDLREQTDTLWQKHGVERDNIDHQRVERLIEMQWLNGELSLTDRAPINLQLTTSSGRNWEGIVRLEDRGFLLVTDKHPKTLLGFVADSVKE